jgi:peptide/nickel transport system substrate-binding protein
MVWRRRLRRQPRSKLVAIAMLAIFIGTSCGTACATPSPGERSSSGSTIPRSGPTKRIVAGVLGLPVTLNTIVGGPNLNAPGTAELAALLHVGLTVQDPSGLRAPRLAATTPTLENGLWKVLSDGRMEMTFPLRPDARWHDGTPVTAEDLVFTAAVAQDPTLSLVRPQIYAFVDRVEAPDARTVLVHWKQPYIEADTIFGGGDGTDPLPKHLLADAVLNPETFTEQPYWNRAFIGAGPYRLKEWVAETQAIVAANPAYLLGQPPIDEIEVRFISDYNTMVANVLAGTLDLTMGRGLSLEQGLQLQRQWTGGRVDLLVGGAPLTLGPQHRVPDPWLVGDPQFRRALVHAINRQDLVDSLLEGVGAVADTPIPPNDRLLQDATAGVVRYPYDPRRAVQLLEGMGLSRGGDGGFRDPAGASFRVELRQSGADDLEQKTVLAVAESWNRIGVPSDPVFVPPARQRDREYRANYPGFEAGTVGNTVSARDLSSFRASELRTPEKNYQGNNRTGYVNAELERLVDRYIITIPLAERKQVLTQVVHHLTDQVVGLYLMFIVKYPTVISHRLVQVDANADIPVSWNAHEWDLR